MQTFSLAGLYRYHAKFESQQRCDPRHDEGLCFLGVQHGPPLTQQCPAAWMDPDQTGDERHTMENKGQVSAIRGVGERGRAVDSRASMTQNQSSVSATVRATLSNRGGKGLKQNTGDRLSSTTSFWPTPVPILPMIQPDTKLLEWTDSSFLNTKSRLVQF